MPDSGLDVAVGKIEARLEAHLDACALRYREGNERLEKLFAFIKDAHDENRKDIGEIKNTLSEQRGAGKMMKIIGAAGAGVMGILGGVGGSHLLK